MVGFASGFLTLVLPAVLGYLARRLGIISDGAERDLNRLVFYFALPAMVLSNLFTADLTQLFGLQLLVQIIVIAFAILLYLFLNQVLPGTKVTGGPLIIGVLAGFYANLGNIGIPIALAVVGDASVMVPFLLLQQLVFMPIALASLERASVGSFSWRQLLALPFKNPLLLTAAVGLAIAALRIQVPELITVPLRAFGAGAVPMVMVAFGAGLVGRRLLSETKTRGALAIIIKSLLMPVAAFAFSQLLGLSPRETLIAVMVAGLPTAGNVYNFSQKFGIGEPMARDAVAATTIISPIVIFVLALVLATY